MNRRRSCSGSAPFELFVYNIKTFLKISLKKVLTKEENLAIMQHVLVTRTKSWDHSSAGRASALQAEGHRFEPYWSHSWRDSSVGQSTRFIPVVSWVQIPLSLLKQRKRNQMVSLFLFYCENGLMKQCETSVLRRPKRSVDQIPLSRTETKSLSVTFIKTKIFLVKFLQYWYNI